MVAVAEQFGNLRDTLGSVLGIFTLMRWIRTLLARLTGRPLPADATALTPAAFARFEGGQQPAPAAVLGPDGRPTAKPSRKPLFFFLLAAFGLPYVMGKLIRSMAASHEEEERKRQAAMALQQQAAQLDPSKLEFCRVLYDFSPAAHGPGDSISISSGGGGEMVPGVDLQVAKGDLVAVLGKTDPLGSPSEWWRCRARDGRVGYLPSTFLEVLQRTNPRAALPAAIQNGSASAGSSRANSLRAQTITSETAEKMAGGGVAPAPAAANGTAGVVGVPPRVETKMGDVSAESFQKSHFYS
jgi:peroxin-13